MKEKERPVRVYVVKSAKHLSFNFFVCDTCVHICVQVNTYTWESQRLTSRVLLNCASLYFLRQVSH